MLPWKSIIPSSDIHQLPERLTAAITRAEKITYLEQVLQSKLIRSQPDPLITLAIQKIGSAGGMLLSSG